jgi:uncharacterized protein (TIGR02757 family)
MNHTALKNYLEVQYRAFHRPEYLRMDPLVCLASFERAEDIEIAALVAAVLSYGRAETIIRNVTEIFGRTGRSIAAFAAGTTLAEKTRCFSGFRHRFTGGDDIAALLHGIGNVRLAGGSLEMLFAEGFRETDTTIRHGLEHFTAALRRIAGTSAPSCDAGVGYLLASPADGSACKRLNMYLRWMIRKNDGIDLGVWKTIPASCLIMPVDTHVARISRRLGLTKRASVDWRMAEEITGLLRACDGADPVRYDFSLCRAGMVDFRREAA